MNFAQGKMKVVLLLCGILGLGLASPSSRIISGTEASVGQLPWMVSIEAEHLIGYDLCGGALLNDEWILTSASCVASGITWEVHLGGITTNLIEIGRVTMTAKAVLNHPSYDSVTKNFDVALIHLPKKVELNDRIKPIALPKKGTIVGSLATVNIAGWGSTKAGGGNSSKLRYVDLSSISNLNCQDYYGKEEIVASTVCATGFLEATPCAGDVGGPLYTTNSEGKSTIVGVFSFFHKNGCDSHKPTVYVRTEPLLTWIQDVTGIPPTP